MCRTPPLPPAYIKRDARISSPPTQNPSRRTTSTTSTVAPPPPVESSGEELEDDESTDNVLDAAMDVKFMDDAEQEAEAHAAFDAEMEQRREVAAAEDALYIVNLFFEYRIGRHRSLVLDVSLGCAESNQLR